MANKIHQLQKNLFAFFCPGCQCNHAFNSSWSFNGEYCTHDLAGQTVDVPDWEE